MPRRRVARPSAGSVTRDAQPIFTWATPSSVPRGGQIIYYETRLEENGLIRCNCPGWIFAKGEPAAKSCKHKLQVESEAQDILRRFQRGETFEVLNPEVTAALPSERAAAKKSSTPTDNSRARFGRVIELD